MTATRRTSCDDVPLPSPALAPTRTWTFVVVILVSFLATMVIAPQAARADPAGNTGGFDPGLIFSDAEMFDGGRLDAAQVDARLKDLGARCDSRAAAVPCLKDQRLDTPARAKDAYCAAIAPRTQASIGTVIADTARACSINPQLIITMLQKEQGLVTTTEPTQRKMAQALGFRCPDFSTCDPKYAGLANQIYHASSRLQQYGDPSQKFTYQIGRQLVAYSPYPFCGRAVVDIRNRATAALYNYTPFTPSQATLDAGAGVVADDACAAYGNRNVHRIYAQWFGSPNGAPASRQPVAAPMGERPPTVFTDVPPGMAFSTEMAWMKFAKISTGYPDGTYRPLEPISREAMAAFLYRAAGSPAFTAPAGAPFSDVSPGSTIFFREIAWAKSEGIVTGYPDGTFRPSDPVNRDAMVAFIYRLSGSPAFTPGNGQPFTDVPPGTLFATEMQWARATGISTGYSDGTFRPLDPVNRDAMAAFLYRRAF